MSILSQGLKYTVYNATYIGYIYTVYIQRGPKVWDFSMGKWSMTFGPHCSLYTVYIVVKVKCMFYFDEYVI